jgi:hypothetical protein
MATDNTLRPSPLPRPRHWSQQHCVLHTQKVHTNKQTQVLDQSHGGRVANGKGASTSGTYLHELRR